MIFASDGVWDEIKPDEAVEIVEAQRLKGGGPKECSKVLAEAARAKWSGKSYIDDITTLVVFLNPPTS